MRGKFRLAGLCAMAAAALGGCTSPGGELGPGSALEKPITAISLPAGSNEDFIVNVGRRVYFSENSSDLDETARATLDKQAAWLTSYPGYKVKIEGFADEKGTPDFNRQLGLKRAQATMSYFALKGIAATRMRVKTFGSERPVRKCEELACWSQNRRVVTVLDTEVGA